MIYIEHTFRHINKTDMFISNLSQINIELYKKYVGLPKVYFA